MPTVTYELPYEGAKEMSAITTGFVRLTKKMNNVNLNAHYLLKKDQVWKK